MSGFLDNWRDAFTERGIIPKHYRDSMLNRYVSLYGAPVFLNDWADFHGWLNHYWLRSEDRNLIR